MFKKGQMEIHELQTRMAKLERGCERLVLFFLVGVEGWREWGAKKVQGSEKWLLLTIFTD